MHRTMIAVAFLAGACASVDDVEMSSERLELAVAGDYAVMAECVHDFARARHSSSVDVDLDSLTEGVASIVFVTTAQNAPMYSVEARQSGDTVRFSLAWAGDANRAHADAAVEACAVEAEGEDDAES